MPTTGDDVLDLILADEDGAANAEIAADHLYLFPDTLRAAVRRAALSAQATSGSSHTIATGSKVFQLGAPTGWKAGTPLYVTEDGDPTARFMIGVTTVDDDGTGLITVNITSVTTPGPTGPYTAWVLRVLHSATTVASGPLGIADGGTGATTEETARLSLGLSVVRLAGERANSPVSIGVDAWALVGPAGTGDFAGQDDKWAMFDGVAWAFTDPSEGDLALVSSDLVRTQIETQGAQNSILVYTTGTWAVIHPGFQAHNSPINSNLTIASGQLETIGPVRIYKNNTSTPTWTLPHTIAANQGAVTVIFSNVGASGSATVNVASAGTIDGSATLTVTAGQSRSVVYVSAGLWQTL